MVASNEAGVATPASEDACAIAFPSEGGTDESTGDGVATSSRLSLSFRHSFGSQVHVESASESRADLLAYAFGSDADSDDDESVPEDNS